MNSTVDYGIQNTMQTYVVNEFGRNFSMNETKFKPLRGMVESALTPFDPPGLMAL